MSRSPPQCSSLCQSFDPAVTTCIKDNKTYAVSMVQGSLHLASGQGPAFPLQCSAAPAPSTASVASTASVDGTSLPADTPKHVVTQLMVAGRMAETQALF
tara:strand:+ start:118 stop:417 length:300 start_codon:yes stop_codon:yes gene_type:complete